MTVTFTNNSSIEIKELHFAQPSTKSWSKNMIDMAGMYGLGRGQSISFNLPSHGSWDFAFGNGNNQYCYFNNIRVEGANNSFSIGNEDIANCF